MPLLGMGELEEKESEVDIYNRHPKELVDLICRETGTEARWILDMDCYLYDPTVGVFCVCEVACDAGRSSQ